MIQEQSFFFDCLAEPASSKFYRVDSKFLLPALLLTAYQPQLPFFLNFPISFHNSAVSATSYFDFFCRIQQNTSLYSFLLKKVYKLTQNLLCNCDKVGLRILLIDLQNCSQSIFGQTASYVECRLYQFSGEFFIKQPQDFCGQFGRLQVSKIDSDQNGIVILLSMISDKDQQNGYTSTCVNQPITSKSTEHLEFFQQIENQLESRALEQESLEKEIAVVQIQSDPDKQLSKRCHLNSNQQFEFTFFKEDINQSQQTKLNQSSKQLQKQHFRDYQHQVVINYQKRFIHRDKGPNNSPLTSPFLLQINSPRRRNTYAYNSWYKKNKRKGFQTSLRDL